MEESIRRDLPFLNSVFTIVQHIVKTELRNTSKHLIINYLKESEGSSLSEKARESVLRYTGEVIPTLEDVQKKSKISSLNQLDHLILKMEYHARQISKE